MASPVHIARHDKIYISALADTKYTNFMFSVNVPIITVSLLAEGKDLRHLATLCIIAPQFPALFKCKIIVVAVTGKRDIVLGNTQVNSRIGNYTIVWIKYLICCTLKVKQHYHFICIAETEIFIHCI